MLGHALIDTLIPAADQDDAFPGGELLRHRLVEHASLSRQQHDFRLRPRTARPDPELLQALEDRLRLQHHAFAAAEWTIVHRAMPVVRKGTQIVQRDLRQPELPRPPHDAVIERTAEKVGEDR